MSNHSFNPFIAKNYGIVESILIDSFIFWTRTNAAKDSNYFEGRYWVFGTPEYFARYFPYLIPRKIRSVLEKLVKSGVLIKGNFNKKGYDKTNWYSLSDNILFELNLDRTCLATLMNPHSPKSADAFAKICGPIPDTKPDTKQNLTTTTTDVTDPDRSSSSISKNFNQCKTAELESLKNRTDETDKTRLQDKFRHESLNDENCKQVYKERFSGIGITLEQLYEECADYWQQSNQMVYKARFLTHLQKTPVYKYDKKAAGNSSGNAGIKAEETEEQRKARFQRYAQEREAQRKRIYG